MASPEQPFDHVTDMSEDSDSDSRNSRESRKRIAEHLEDSEDSSKRIKLVDDRCQNDKNGDTSRYYRKGGLSNSLHGNIYQLKLLALFMKRALDENYEFLLGTEVEAAYKWDDIVLLIKRQGEIEIYEIIVLQAKHKLDESKKITASDLLSDDDDFSLQKYFISNLKMRQHPQFNKNKVKNFIIYTNIDFDYSNLKDMSVNTKDISENDPLLKVTKSIKTVKRVKLSASKDHILYEKLRETTDLHVLAKELKQHIGNKSTVKLTRIFKHYMYALSKTVFHIKTETVRKNCKKLSATFRDEFINGLNLSEDVQNFRNILQLSLQIENSDKFKETLSQTQLPVSKAFAQVIDFHLNPIIEDSKCLAKTFADFVFEAQNEQRSVITISRTRNVIDSNINKLAFHILVQDERENGLVKFSKIFFDESRNLKGNLDKFRADLKAAFKMRGVDFFQVRRHKFKISKFCTCEETSEGDVVYPKTKLPSDTVKDTDIEDFLDKLVFAVNQPNELELGEIISEEMGLSSQFNLLDANLVSNSFQNKMLDWFKEKRPVKNKEGVWLDAKRGKEFMNSIEQQVSVLISSGISIAYPDKLAKFDVTFRENKISKKIKMFLSKENVSEKILYIITPEKETLLSALNVYNSLETLKQQEEYALYQKSDSCIFMRLKTLLVEKIQSHIIHSFELSGCCHLLIVDCQCTASPRNEMIKLCRKLSFILKGPNKKIIIIAEKEYDIIENFDEDLKSNITTDTDDITFHDLTDKSKSMLLQKEVIFQGRRKKVCLKKLINQSDEKAKDVINVEIILKLLRNEEIRIGKELKDLSEINEYYVHRKFKPVVFSAASIHKCLEESTSNSDFFVVTGANCGLQHINIYAFDDTQRAEKKFKELLVEHSNLCNIHWLQSDSKNLILYKSHGSILNLMPYRIQNDQIANYTTCPYSIEESKLIDECSNRDKIIIISGKAGMGKSTVLTNLSMELMNDPSLWVVRINLNDHRKIFYEIIKNETFTSFGESVDSIINFLLNDLMVVTGTCEFEKDLFINNFKSHQKIAFLFDGFDEIIPDFEGIVIYLLQSLRKFKVKKIFVTTRPNFTQKVEEALEVFSYYLAPFLKDEQVKFLTKFWAKKLNKENLVKLKTYAEAIIKQISEWINDKKKEFVSLPLHLMMIAEVFKKKKKNEELTSDCQDCEEFLDSDLSSPELPKSFKLVKLYDKFIERKYYDFYLSDKRVKYVDSIANTAGKMDPKEEYYTFKVKHGLLAMQLLFNTKELNKLLSSSEIIKIKALIEDFNDAGHLKGFVDQIIEDKPQFIHRTFAEYFASIVIAEKILASPTITLQMLNNAMQNMSPIFMHSIIEQLTGKHETLTLALGKPLLHFILTESCSNFLKLLIQCYYNDWQKELDASGKTPLHYAVEGGQSDIVGKLLKYANDIHTNEILKHGSFKHPDYANSLLVKFVNVEDNDGKTALCYAVQHNYLDEAFELLLKGASITLLTDDKINALIRHMINYKYDDDISIYEDGILRAYANQENKYRPIQEKLFRAAPGFFNKLCRKDQSRILSYFFVQGRVKIIDTLLATINDPEERKQVLNNDDNLATPLDRVLESDNISDENRLEITNYLFKHDGFSMRYTRYGDVSAMDAVLRGAARMGHIKTLKYFICLEERSDFNDIVYDACRFNQFSVVKYMYENHKNRITDSNGNTALHAACDIGKGVSLEIIKYLIDNGDINAKNHYGETPLSCSKKRKTYNVIEYLISKGAIDSIDYNEDEDIQDSDHVVVDGYPKLHSAIKAKQFELVKSLIRQGENINEKDSNGDAPLHLCVLMDYDEQIVELLLQYGAIFDIRNRSNSTPYYLIRNRASNPGISGLFIQEIPGLEALFRNKPNSSKVYWLLRVLNKLFSSQNLMEDLNTELLTSRSWGKLENRGIWGPYGSGHPDVWDGDNPMLFILNPRNNQGKTLVHIAADTNDVEALHTILKFNHGYLELKLESERFIRYRDYQSISVNSIDFDGDAPIHLAARKGHTQIVCRLLEEGAKFNSIGSDGVTLECLATNNNHADIVDLLQPTKHLFVALENRIANEIEKYVSRSVFIHARNYLGKTALHLAAHMNEHIVKLLLDNGADINATDDNGDTPLHTAATEDKCDIVMLLIHYGAMYNTKNTKGKKPLDIAHGQSCDLLERIDASFKDIQSDEPQRIIAKLETYDEGVIATIVHSRDHEGNTLLHYAAGIEHFKIVHFLLGNGAIYDAKNVRKQFALDNASAQNIIYLLTTIKGMFENLQNVYEGLKTIDIKIIKNVLDCERKSLLDYATERRESEIILFLRDIIADE